LIVTELDPALDFVSLVMVGLSKLNILSSLAGSEVSEEMRVDCGASNCSGRVGVSSTLDTCLVGSIGCGIDMSPIHSWVVQNVC